MIVCDNFKSRAVIMAICNPPISTIVLIKSAFVSAKSRLVARSSSFAFSILATALVAVTVKVTANFFRDY